MNVITLSEFPVSHTEGNNTMQKGKITVASYTINEHLTCTNTVLAILQGKQLAKISQLVEAELKFEF
jgi:hypothetical protein